MTRIPTTPLLLGLAGLIPFIWGAITSIRPDLASLSSVILPPRLNGPVLMQVYGLTILSFMAGVIWGFAARTDGRKATLFYALSVLPPIWGVLTASGPTEPALYALIAGFVVLLPIDWSAARNGAAPSWWMSLRLLLTAVVVICLIVGGLAA